ncbi:hypothetical protein SAMN04487891_112174 [Flagellimonas taeanensis]|uniref:Uncharacterized protein n=1 Tax=Flagellimonas taeanensis TaxID=1005926 RepID=A0A1M7C2V1_9FLAO|nr:hypothetical protein SAMN04487891_112174 [Allomuricauda taeanensis]SHL61550.1 hypothetical protein SAMN05216293_3918 [Allomuricauda taeanensis]
MTPLKKAFLKLKKNQKKISSKKRLHMYIFSMQNSKSNPD